MNLDNQLLVREKSTQHCCMCSTATDVGQFLMNLAGYELTHLEYRVLNDFMESVLPLRDFHLSEKRRVLLIVNQEGHISELAYKEMDGVSKHDAVPEGCRMIGQIFAGAYTKNPSSVARFDFGTETAPITINLSRKCSGDSLPHSLAEELWSQQLASFENPSVPPVQADLVPYDITHANQQVQPKGNYTLKIGEEQFLINQMDDLSFCLSALLEHPLSESILQFFADVFSHLENFPAHKVSSPMVCFYVNEQKNVYVGGEGMINRKKLFYAGKFFPSYFTGNPGNVCSIRIGAFEDEFINVLLFRN